MTLQIRRGHREVTTSSPLFTRIRLDAGQWRRAPTALSVAGDPGPDIMKSRILEMIGATEPERAFGVPSAWPRRWPRTIVTNTIFLCRGRGDLCRRLSIVAERPERELAVINSWQAAHAAA
jgi:hypothetical protein